MSMQVDGNNQELPLRSSTDYYSQNSLTVLRLRHLTRIIGCKLRTNDDGLNLIPLSPLPSLLSRKPLSKGFFITLESANTVYFKSELQPGINPRWDPFDLNKFFPLATLSQKGVVVRVWLKGDENDTIKPILSWGVDFSGLVPLHSNIPANRCEFLHENSLMFKFSERYYTAETCLNDPSSKLLVYPSFLLPLSETKPSCSVSSICRLHALKRSNKQFQQRCSDFEESLVRYGIAETSESIILKKKIESALINLSSLKSRLAAENNSLSSTRDAIECQESANQDKGLELLDGYQILNRRLSLKRQRENELREELFNLKELTEKVKNRRCYLLSQLPLIFPIKQVGHKEESKLTICGLFLPDAEKYGRQSHASLSVAIGYVAQLLVKVAQLVDVPLRFPVTMFGSLSSITDLTTTQLQDISKEFQLYTKGKDKEKLHFDYGVFLLNKNIAQLRWACGLTTPDLRPTLSNIWSLLFHLYNQSNMSYPRAFMPDTVVAPPLSFSGDTENHQINIQTPSSLLQRKNSLPKIQTNENKLLNKEITETSELKSNSSEVLEELNTKSHRNNKEFLKHDSDMSQSLDKGLDSIGSKCTDSAIGKGGGLLLLSSESSEDVKLASGSMNDISSVTKSRDETSGSATDVRMSKSLHKTIEVLRSWHEDESSPYDSSSAAEYPLDDDELVTRDAVADDPIKDCHSDAFKNDEEKSLVDADADAPIKDCNSDALKNDEEKSLVDADADETEVEFSLKDNNFFNDVAHRTAALANQNCSFKFSFSKSSTQE